MVDYKRLENESDEELIYRICSSKEEIGSWQDVADLINKITGYEYTESKYRKQYSAFQKMLNANMGTVFPEEDYLKKLQTEKEELRKERIKMQVANIERSRVDRNISRQELYYEQIGSVCTTLPLPVFEPILEVREDYDKSYLCCLSDLHYGATFKSENNEYSPEIFKQRLLYLTDELYNFVHKNSVRTLHVACLGDTLQGLLRVSDLKLNDTSIVKSVVELSRLIASFLTSLSRFVNVEYYHVPNANHTQLRPLGTKASEIADEDLEYVIGNYIKDLCSANKRINVILADENKQYIQINIEGFEVLAMHGHQIKNIESSLKDLSMLRRSFVDYLILGHFHSGKELPTAEGCLHDTEVLVCPSFIGSDPYSDSLLKGSKASVKIFGFDSIYGHTETYKIILN